MSPTTKRPPPERPIHAVLTIDDRDALDTLRGNIERNAVLLNRALSTLHAEPDDIDEFDEDYRAIVEAGLITLAALIVTDAHGIRAVLNAAEQRLKAGAQ
jgi:hypothetical protein